MASKMQKFIFYILLVVFFIFFIDDVHINYSLAQGELINHYLPQISNNYPPLETGKIVFVSSRSGNSEIYRMNYDGSNLLRLTDNSSEDTGPDWSPDGTKIAFISNRSGGIDIYTMNEDGSNQTKLTDLATCYSPKWSPDGSQIAFYALNNNNLDSIYTMKPDSSVQTQVTPDDIDAVDPDWSPDGSKIAYISQGAVWEINPDGSNPEILFSAPNLAYMAWSPDGKRFALSASAPPDYNFDIYIYDIETATTTRLTNTHYNHNSIGWSPDGNYLVFHSNQEDISNFEIYTMTSSGDRFKNLTNNPAGDSEPDWIK